MQPLASQWGCCCLPRFRSHVYPKDLPCASWMYCRRLALTPSSRHRLEPKPLKEIEHQKFQALRQATQEHQRKELRHGRERVSRQLAIPRLQSRQYSCNLLRCIDTDVLFKETHVPFTRQPSAKPQRIDSLCAQERSQTWRAQTGPKMVRTLRTSPRAGSPIQVCANTTEAIDRIQDSDDCKCAGPAGSCAWTGKKLKRGHTTADRVSVSSSSSRSSCCAIESIRS